MTAPKPTSRLARLADLTYRRRWRVVAAWIATLATVLVIVPQFAGDFDVEFGTPGSESKAAADLLEKHFDGSTGDTVNVVWESSSGARDAKRRIDRLVADAERVDGIEGASPPRYSRDGTIGLVQLRLDRSPMDIDTSSGKRLIELATDASNDGVQVEVGGNLIQQAQEGQPPELMGLLAAALVLLIAFGSIVAAGLPLLVAIFGLGISATLIGVVAALVDTPDFAPAVAGLIGIGVGIDYALLILTRFRAALLDGADERNALVEAVSTAGRSVIVAGGTVVISMLGLSFMGVSFLYGVAVSASLAVLVVVIASITLLPALLAIAGRRIPLFIAGVVLLSFVLLLLAFRAPLIALKAGVMNLFSVGAAYGVVALAAEGGWFGSLLGVDTDTPVPPFIPVMMFAILFGLSMDYEVFLLSRVREEYHRTGKTSDAVAEGLAKTARVITAAAAIMVVVFLAFIFSTEVFLKLMGVGMATAILVDATIVRMVLVPAVMQLLGRANWWIPGWLDRILPRLDGLARERLEPAPAGPRSRG